jgi:hypothetical protein
MMGNLGCIATLSHVTWVADDGVELGNVVRELAMVGTFDIRAPLLLRHHLSYCLNNTVIKTTDKLLLEQSSKQTRCALPGLLF